MLGAVDTGLGLVVTGLSLAVSYRIDRMAALNVLPRFLWLLLATYVSAYVALYNHDPFFGMGPFLGH